MKNAVCLFSFLICVLSGFAQGIQFELNDWDLASEKAQAEDKLIFIDGYTTWCEPCKMMDIQVFNRFTVGDFFNKNFVNLKMDMEKGTGPIFALNYGVTSFPTFLFLTSDGTLVHKIDGYKKAAELIRLAEPALDPDLRTRALHERYEEGDRKPDFLHNYAYLRFREMDNSHREIVQEYLEAEKDWASPRAMQFIYNFIETADSEMFEFMAKNRTAFEAELGRENIARTIDLLVNNKIYHSPQKPGVDEIVALYLLAFPVDGPYMASEYQLNYYQEKGDHLNHTRTAVRHYQEWPPEDLKTLTELAAKINELIDEQEYVDIAEQWTRQAIARDNSVDNYLLLASLQYKQDLTKDAKKTAKSALKLAKKNNPGKVDEVKALLTQIKKA